jgi:hypothetical protein
MLAVVYTNCRFQERTAWWVTSGMAFLDTRMRKKKYWDSLTSQFMVGGKNLALLWKKTREIDPLVNVKPQQCPKPLFRNSS